MPSDKKKKKKKKKKKEEERRPPPTGLRLIIAYRGNQHGPNPELENSEEYLEPTIRRKHDGGLMEQECVVDCWYVNGKFYFGSDEPKYPITKTWIEEYPDSIWCMARDLGAHKILPTLGCTDTRTISKFNWAEGEQQRVLCGDDIDKPVVWGPDPKCLPECVYVLPEKCIECEGLYHCYAVMTEYLHFYKTYLEYYDFQKRVDNKMLRIDPLIAKELEDERRSLALYTLFDEGWEPNGDKLDTMIDDLKQTFPQQNIFSINADDNVLHSMLFTIIGDQQMDSGYPYYEKYQKTYDSIITEALSATLPFKFVFRGLFCTHHGLWMMAYPMDLDLNYEVREKIEKGFQRKALTYMRDVQKAVYAPVLKMNKPMEAGKLQEIAKKYEDTYFGMLTVEKIKLGFCSSRMRADEVEFMKEYTAAEKKD